MAVISPDDLKSALACLAKGEVIAYPTEAVYGLGCDPFQAEAVGRVLQLKHRAVERGLILVAADWQQIQALAEPIPPLSLAHVLASWPGPTTWIFPASPLVPSWIRGRHRGVALRVSNHPVVQELCQHFGGPIVSTSANREGHAPLRDYRAMQMVFGKQVDFIVPGKVGGNKKPTTIRNAVTGDILRE